MKALDCRQPLIDFADERFIQICHKCERQQISWVSFVLHISRFPFFGLILAIRTVRVCFWGFWSWNDMICYKIVDYQLQEACPCWFDGNYICSEQPQTKSVSCIYDSCVNVKTKKQANLLVLLKTKQFAYRHEQIWYQNHINIQPLPKHKSWSLTVSP